MDGDRWWEGDRTLLDEGQEPRPLGVDPPALGPVDEHRALALLPLPEPDSDDVEVP